MKALPLEVKIALRGELRRRGHRTSPAIPTVDLLAFAARAMGPRRRHWLKGSKRANRDNGTLTP